MHEARAVRDAEKSVTVLAPLPVQNMPAALHRPPTASVEEFIRLLPRLRFGVPARAIGERLSLRHSRDTPVSGIRTPIYSPLLSDLPS